MSEACANRFVFALLLARSASSSLPLRAQATPNPLPPGDGADIVAVDVFAVPRAQRAHATAR